MKKRRVAAAALSAVMLTAAMPVQAMSFTTQQNFNYVRYADTYPDLKAGFGYNSNALWNHYATSGQTEGRTAAYNPMTYLTLDNFDAARYAADNPDVAAAIGTDRTALYRHATTNGLMEGRAVHSTALNLDAELTWYRMLPGIIAGCTTDEQKIKAIHDYIVMNTAYGAVTADQAGTKSAAFQATYGVAGLVFYHKCVCQGYCLAFKHAMDYLGIESKVELSDDHGWNAVKLGNTWYYIDCTYDDMLVNGADVGYRVSTYDYYLTPDPSFGGRMHDAANSEVVDVTNGPLEIGY